MSPFGKAFLAPACVCTSPISWLALPPPLPPHSALALRLCRLLSLRRVSACFKVPSPPPHRALGRGLPCPDPGSAPPQGATPSGGLGSQRTGEGVGQPRQNKWGWDRFPHYSPAWTVALRRGWAGELQREEGRGLTVWDGGSQGRGTGDCPREVSRTLGGKALAVVSALHHLGGRGRALHAQLGAICLLSRSAPGYQRGSGPLWVWLVHAAGGVLWTGLRLLWPPGWWGLTSGCFGTWRAVRGRRHICTSGPAPPLPVLQIGWAWGLPDPALSPRGWCCH